MGYRAQLVVRTTDPKEAEVIERVKAMADAQSKSYSEMALELLVRGIGGSAEAPDNRAEPPAKAEQAEEADETASPPVAAAGTTPPPVDIEVAPSGLGPGTTPQSVAEQCLEQLGDDDRDSALSTLADFYTRATPVDGGRLRKQLMRQLSEDEYETLLDELRETEAYQIYRKRVIFQV